MENARWGAALLAALIGLGGAGVGLRAWQLATRHPTYFQEQVKEATIASVIMLCTAAALLAVVAFV